MKSCSFCSSFLFFILIVSGLESFGQENQNVDLNIKLEDKGNKIENIILLDISEYDYEAMQAVTGAKMAVKAKRLIINGDTLIPEEITTRGQSTLQFKRKSLGIKLTSKAVFRHDKQIISLRKFDVLNLSMDKYYFHNRLAFGLMEELGIFHLFYSYCELRINGKSQGIFLVIERPEDWALGSQKSPLVLRRGYGHKIEKMKSASKTEGSITRQFLSNYNKVYRSLNKFEGEELYNNISKWMDTDNYMKWLAFNFLVRNGDYSDEVFFYIDPEIYRYRIIPWDYDDIFAVAPHEGAAEKKKAIGDKLLFSSEDQLDRKIASDTYLYNIYLRNMKEVLDELLPSQLVKAFENCYAELYPYYSERQITENAQYDLYKDANIENLRNELITIFIGLNGRRSAFLKALGESDK